MKDHALRDLLRSPSCQGVGGLHLVAREPFWDASALPFSLHGGGTVLRVVPEAGFRRENLAATPDERLLIVDCPDDEGWLVPYGVVAGWLGLHVTCPPLDDLLLAHPLYSYTTKVDGKGRSRMGRERLAHWAPGVPTIATLAEPPFRPDDPEAPPVNRDRHAYADAVVDLVKRLRHGFDLLEVEVSVVLD